jgi:ornithine racemase
MKNEITPRIEIDLQKIRHNAQVLKNLYGERGIKITGVVKGVDAILQVANALLEVGITSLADSRIANIKKLKKAGLKATLLLLRTPAMSEVKLVVEFADISMNTELEVIRALSAEAVRRNKIHPIILMIEMGDIREGILCENVPSFIREVLKLPGVKIDGIGTNFACFGGVVPTEQKMRKFSNFVSEMQELFSLKFPIVSGGNSANYNWLVSTKDTGVINNIRIGESILLGRETVSGKLIPGLYPDAFCFIAEVIESKLKPSVPIGLRSRNAFGETLSFKDCGLMRRALLGVGRQDVLVSGLTPLLPVEIIGSSSDHIILNTKDILLKPGDEVKFSLDYGALLSVMTSPYIYKKFLHQMPIKHGSLNKTPA